MIKEYLKSEQYYVDLYDKQTVEHCRVIESRHYKTFKEKGLYEESCDPEKRGAHVAVMNLHLYFEKGESYRKKAETIKSWMERDAKRDEFIKSAKAPHNITCLTCGRIMFMSLESFEMGFDEKPDKVLYFYDCPLNHSPKRAFYNNGVEYKSKKTVCSKCGGDTKDTHKKSKKKVVTTWECLVCSHIDSCTLDLTPDKKDKEVVDDKYIQDRDRFCLSEKNGQEYIMSQHALKEVTASLEKVLHKEKDQEERKDVYDKVASLKKLKILEVEELLKPLLEKAGYLKFHTKDPEITKDVYLPFVVYDTKQDRADRVSVFDLNKLVKKTLEKTNWRLMSDGCHYRLGMLEGKLRAYEREEDLLKLVMIKNKNRTITGKDGDEITL